MKSEGKGELIKGKRKTNTRECITEMAKFRNTTQLVILREASSLGTNASQEFQNNCEWGDGEGDEGGRKVDKLIFSFSFASPLPVFEVHLKGGTSLLVKASMCLFQPAHKKTSCQLTSSMQILNCGLGGSSEALDSWAGGKASGHCQWAWVQLGKLMVGLVQRSGWQIANNTHLT